MTERMKDWKLTSKAWNLPVTDEDLDKIIPSLNGLEAAFRPLVQSLGPNTESAMIYVLKEPA